MKNLWLIFIFFCTQNGNETNPEVKKNSQSRYDGCFSVSRHSKYQNQNHDRYAYVLYMLQKNFITIIVAKEVKQSTQSFCRPFVIPVESEQLYNSYDQHCENLFEL